MKLKVGDNIIIGKNKSYTYKITDIIEQSPSYVKISFVCVKSLHKEYLGQLYKNHGYTPDQYEIVKPTFEGHRLTKIFK